MKRDLISMLDLSSAEIDMLLDGARRLKEGRGEAQPLLSGKTLGMIFEKASTRTRVSFEVGMFELGGHALFLNAQDLQLGRGEEIRDTARVLSRYLSAVMIRAYHHSTITEFAKYASVPVINALSDLEHPCQILADLLTIRERKGSEKGLAIAWVGDGNNVANSLILGSARQGYAVRAATPPGYAPPSAIVDAARAEGGDVTLLRSPAEAAEGADVIYTDTWISMGSEAEALQRRAALRGYTVDEALLSRASPDAIVMHCLPAHRGEEITDEVMEGVHSVVWDQAENRLHTEKALLVWLIEKEIKDTTRR